MISEVITRLNRSSFYRNVIWVASGTGAAQLIAIASTPIITRLYTPADYGVLTVIVSILGLIQPLSTLTYSTAIPIADEDSVAQHLVALCFIITLGISVLVALGTTLFAGPISVHFSAPKAARYLWLLPVCVLGSGAFETLSGWAIRSKAFRVVAQTKALQGLSGAGVKIGLGLLSVGPLGLLGGVVASSAAGSGNIAKQLYQEDPWAFRHLSRSGLQHAAKRFSQFPLVRLWSRLLLGLDGKLPALFIASLFGSEVVGSFGLAKSIVSLPFALIGSSVAQVYFAEIARYGRSEPGKIRDLSLSIMRKTLFVGGVTMLPIVIAAPQLFTIIFGPEWHGAGRIARLLSAASLVGFVGTPVAHCLDALERQGTQLALNVARLVLIVAVFLVSMGAGLSISATVAVYSLALSLYSLFSIVLILSILRTSCGGKPEPS